ncbi:Cadmium resistance transporter [Trichormus variabilis ATCC 29413]|uniref:Cadmium resistance transporter n=2 Tax=Anabaena variabilis TaxID=264691 RepID=Q3M316_TRIV2|nr:MULTISPECIES: cadmium resistance transporter [Nostocaceae]ABA24620.1 Cadmium resistance transporter [Trichormus variabilis ATCC 29413]MBC1213467.1 cadmium resistance transporter [Trichormus variabilis ARAD]MBC1258042.1 cadmium resistance transporter [Trichormus variabilis V5]MBC1266488.1 cadmium resistance transporter [Trichormus variabilis FSR]MBC1301958.1 cadmium resistance transporter [Trichormus variabilis N2B]
MSELLTAISTGFTAFVATNLDDIVVLSLFFSQINACFRRRHIFIGQYLGFSALVVASLPSFFGRFIIPGSWIGLLGIAPIIIGINRLLNQETSDTEDLNTLESSPSWWNNFLSPQTYGVAAVTIANGSDNISIYMPMFATNTWDNLLVILLVFFVMVGVWCYLAYHLTQIKAIASAITHYGNSLVPFLLIGLGVSIFIESQTIETPILLFIICVSIGSYLLILSKNIWRVNYRFSLEAPEAEVIPGIKQK